MRLSPFHKVLHGQKYWPRVLAVAIGTGHQFNHKLQGQIKVEPEPPVLVPSGFLAIRHRGKRQTSVPRHVPLRRLCFLLLIFVLEV